jgi:hypothetical protein
MTWYNHSCDSRRRRGVADGPKSGLAFPLASDAAIAESGWNITAPVGKGFRVESLEQRLAALRAIAAIIDEGAAAESVSARGR